MFRLFLEKGYETHALYAYEEEMEPEKKYKLLFYLAEYYLMQGKHHLAQSYFLEIEDKCTPGTIECRLAKHELERYL